MKVARGLKMTLAWFLIAAVVVAVVVYVAALNLTT